MLVSLLCSEPGPTEIVDIGLDLRRKSKYQTLRESEGGVSRIRVPKLRTFRLSPTSSGTETRGQTERFRDELIIRGENHMLAFNWAMFWSVLAALIVAGVLKFICRVVWD
jgi:hypothetical protein